MVGTAQEKPAAAEQLGWQGEAPQELKERCGKNSVLRQSTLDKIAAASWLVAFETVISMKDHGRVALPKATVLRQRSGVGTANAEAAISAARDILIRAGAATERHRRSVLFSAGSIDLEASERDFRQRHLTYMQCIEEQVLLKRQRQHLTGLSCESGEKKRRGPVINITAAADALTAGLRNALREGADAVVFAPGPHEGGATVKSVQARFKCGADVSERVIRHAQARLSMAGYKSQGYAKNPRQMVYYRAEEGAKDKKRPLACPGLAPTKRLKEEAEDADVPPSLPPARKAVHQIVGRPLPGVALKLEEQEHSAHQKLPCKRPLCQQPPRKQPLDPQLDPADPQLGPADAQCSAANPSGSVSVPQWNGAALISDERVRWSWALLHWLEKDPLVAARALAGASRGVAGAIARDACDACGAVIEPE